MHRMGFCWLTMTQPVDRTPFRRRQKHGCPQCWAPWVDLIPARSLHNDMGEVIFKKVLHDQNFHRFECSASMVQCVYVCARVCKIQYFCKSQVSTYTHVCMTNGQYLQMERPTHIDIRYVPQEQYDKHLPKYTRPQDQNDRSQPTKYRNMNVVSFSSAFSSWARGSCRDKASTTTRGKLPQLPYTIAQVNT